MDRNTTNLLKFICCILIFLHHYFLTELWVSTFGRIACSIFYFLSAYGTTKSLQLKPISFMNFCKRRLSKLYIPLLLINFVFVTLGYIIYGGIPIFNIIGNISFVEKQDTFSLASYIIGWKKIDGVTWFLDVLIVSYLLLYFTSKLKRRFYRSFCVVGAWCIFLASDRLLNLTICLWPTDTIGIILGYLFAEYENFNIRVAEFLRSKTILYCNIGCFLLAVTAYIALTDVVRWRYLLILMFIYSVFSILISYDLAYNFELKKKRLFTVLGTISYFVYLLHMKVICSTSYFLCEKNLIYSFCFTFIIGFFIMYISNAVNNKLHLK